MGIVASGDEMEEDFEREVAAIGGDEAVERLVEGEGIGGEASAGPSQASEELEGFFDHSCGGFRIGLDEKKAMNFFTERTTPFFAFPLQV